MNADPMDHLQQLIKQIEEDAAEMATWPEKRRFYATHSLCASNPDAFPPISRYILKWSEEDNIAYISITNPITGRVARKMPEKDFLSEYDQKIRGNTKFYVCVWA